MTKNELLTEYEKLKDRADMITLFIHMPDDSTEVLYNTKVDNKIEYIKQTYDDNLIHNNCKEIYIQDVHISTMDDTMDLGAAIVIMRDENKKVARKGWNGKGMFLYYVPSGAYAPRTEVAKTLVNKNGLVEYGAYIAMKTAQGNVVPWLASQTDLLAEDWCVVE